MLFDTLPPDCIPKVVVMESEEVVYEKVQMSLRLPAAPLVWCRVSAAATRLGQACFLSNDLRMQIFVDDSGTVCLAHRSVHVTELHEFANLMAL